MAKLKIVKVRKRGGKGEGKRREGQEETKEEREKGKEKEGEERRNIIYYNTRYVIITVWHY